MECAQWDLDFWSYKERVNHVFFLSLKSLGISKVCGNFCGMRIACCTTCCTY